MIQRFKKQRLAFITLVYWFLLLYIIAALVWWFIALHQQNQQIANDKKLLLNENESSFIQKVAKIKEQEKRKDAQYIGEGATFLLLIFVGAVFVYRSVRKQIKLSDQQQNFMMAVTHELNTPITIAQLNLETLQKHKLDEAQQQKLISSSLEETNRLGALTNNILTLSQLESGNYHINKQEINFSELVENVAGDFIKRFPQRSISKNINPDIFIEGEHVLLQLMLNNLTGNAIKYSPKEKTIHIKLEASNGHALLSIADEGKGINNGEKKKIFEKFYRVGNEATRTAKGTGLGLYLCKKIVQDHKGKIEVADNKPTGSIFTVTLNAI